MTDLMPDSWLNGAERRLQHSLRIMNVFNGLLVACSVAVAYFSIRDLPQRQALPSAQVPLTYRIVDVTPSAGPLRLAGAWELTTGDRRFGGLSSLALDQGRFLAVSDRGAVTRFDPPTSAVPVADIKDLRSGPGPWGRKWSRDAESLAPDARGRGWWVGYEQRHSLWLYDSKFDHAVSSLDLKRDDWWDNRGAEALIEDGDSLLVLAENGRDSMRVGPSGIQRIPLKAGADVAEAARAPDGSVWILLRTKSWKGISQQVAPLVRAADGFGVGQSLPLPKAPFDNLEGMAIEARPGGAWRFWLVSDDGHRVMARTLLIALDYVPPARHDKSPATGAGLSN
jgi:hypothetical protein